MPLISNGASFRALRQCFWILDIESIRTGWTNCCTVLEWYNQLLVSSAFWQLTLFLLALLLLWSFIFPLIFGFDGFKLIAFHFLKISITVSTSVGETYNSRVWKWLVGSDCWDKHVNNTNSVTFYMSTFSCTLTLVFCFSASVLLTLRCINFSSICIRSAFFSDLLW